MLETIEIETNPKISAQASIIWMHGLGADGHDFAPIVPALKLPPYINIRFVFPHAPVRPVTINHGMAMRAWYDILAIDPKVPEDREGLENSRKEIFALIEKEHHQGIPYHNIILAGFSQGGALALYTGMRFPQQLAGIIALSTYIPLYAYLEQEMSDVALKQPIFMAHGLHDAIVPFVLAEYARRYMQRLGFDVTWKTYPMEHQVCNSEIEDISSAIHRMLHLKEIKP